MLKPATMQRIAVMGLREERKRVVSILYDLGVMQIEPLSKAALPFLKSGIDTASGREVSEELLRIRALYSALPRGPSREKMGFSSFDELFKASRSIAIDAEVEDLKQGEEKLKVQMDDLNNRMDLVTKLSSFVDVDLAVFDLRSAASFFGVVSAQAHAELLKGLASIGDAMVSSSGKDPVSVVVVVPNAGLEKFGAIIQKADVRMQRIPPMKGKPQQVLASLQEEKRAKEAELVRIAERLMALSEKYFGLISSVEEQLSIEARKLEVVNVFGFTDSAFVVEGWVPAFRLAGLEDVLKRLTPSTRLFKIASEAGDKPPTLMQNPKRLKFFESFIRFYSLPQSSEFDPTLIFAFTFPIFFGLMLGDVGYGLVILGISFWILRRVKRGGGKTIVPRQIRSFARNIFKPSAFQKLAMAMIPGAIVGIILGFIFNEYFGFRFNQYLFVYLNTNYHIGLPSSGAFLDPISSRGLKNLLSISGYIGLFEVSLGLILGMVNGYWTGERRHMFGKLGWLLVAWGIALIGLTVLHHGNANPEANPLAGGYIVAAVVGLGLIAYGEGAQSLIELPSIISHIISYTRLVGILLASVILAEVIDLVFAGALAGGIALAIGGVVILIFGQLFNIILALFEPGIQGARLIYVEFFSKFFHGGGRPFLPFKGRRTYTTSEIDLMEPETKAAMR